MVYIIIELLLLVSCRRRRRRQDSFVAGDDAATDHQSTWSGGMSKVYLNHTSPGEMKNLSLKFHSFRNSGTFIRLIIIINTTQASSPIYHRRQGKNENEPLMNVW